MLMLEYRSVAWWYWLVTVCLLTAGLSGVQAGFALAIVLTVVQLIHFALRERKLTSFPLQVRLGYFLLLLVSLPQSMQWLYWLPTIGTWVQVCFGYCLMARMVSLLPWNRRQLFSLALVRRTFLSAPVRGNILQGLPPLPGGRDTALRVDAAR